MMSRFWCHPHQCVACVLHDDAAAATSRRARTPSARCTSAAEVLPCSLFVVTVVCTCEPCACSVQLPPTDNLRQAPLMAAGVEPYAIGARGAALSGCNASRCCFSCLDCPSHSSHDIAARCSRDAARCCMPGDSKTRSCKCCLQGDRVCWWPCWLCATKRFAIGTLILFPGFKSQTYLL